jgi:DNA-binding beta-propeller fold protein YncE
VASVAVVAGISAGVALGVQALTTSAPPQMSPLHPVTAYVLSGSGRVIPIRTATNTALRPIKVGRGPPAIAVAQQGGRAGA